VTTARKLSGVAGWIKLAIRSFAAGGLFAAAQLGAAQALSMFVWSSVPAPDVWRRQLMWLLFVFAAAVLGGVAGGRRSVRAIRIAIANRRAIAASQRHSGLTLHKSGVRAASRRAVTAAKEKTVDKARGFVAGAALVGAVVFAVLGAAAGFVLVWLPARSTFGPADMRTMALTAGLGIAVGAIVSLLALAAAPIAANACATVVWTWVLGLTSVGLAIATGRPTGTPSLGVLDAPYLIGPHDWWLGPNLMIVFAVVIGFAVAATARWIGANRLGVALSGLAGPGVVAAGYVLVGPTEESMSGYVAALLAATAGLLTTAATAAAHRRAATPPEPAALPSGSAALAGTAIAALPAAPTAPPPAPLAIEARPAVPATGRAGKGRAKGYVVAPEPVMHLACKMAVVTNFFGKVRRAVRDEQFAAVLARMGLIPFPPGRTAVLGLVRRRKPERNAEVEGQGLAELGRNWNLRPRRHCPPEQALVPTEPERRKVRGGVGRARRKHGLEAHHPATQVTIPQRLERRGPPQLHRPLDQHLRGRDIGLARHAVPLPRERAFRPL